MDLEVTHVGWPRCPSGLTEVSSFERMYIYAILVTSTRLSMGMGRP